MVAFENRRGAYFKYMSTGSAESTVNWPSERILKRSQAMISGIMRSSSFASRSLIPSFFFFMR